MLSTCDLSQVRGLSVLWEPANHQIVNMAMSLLCILAVGILFERAFLSHHIACKIFNLKSLGRRVAINSGLFVFADHRLRADGIIMLMLMIVQGGSQLIKLLFSCIVV